jgi:hypothetical protein
MTPQNSAVDLGVARRASEAPGMLASDADRDATAGLLGDAFAAGRLTSEEHADRMQAAYGARTWAELAALTSDVPGPASTAPSAAAQVIPSEMDHCLLWALLILCPPAGIAWLLAARWRTRAAGSACA